jgi:cardiolipin synthase C
VFDRRRLFIGSMNVDRPSLHLNTEIGLLIDSPELAEQVAARFESIARPANSYVVQLRRDSPGLVWHTEEDGTLVDHQTEPARNVKQRAQLTFFSLLRLDDEL